MTTATKRPIFLNLLEIKLPIGGVMSILHRISGAVLFLTIPLAIYLLDLSLSGPRGFAAARDLVHGWFGMLATLLVVWSLLHHVLAGVRYLLIDVHIGVEKPLFRQTAWAATLAAPVLALLLTGALL
jgi:succinate dehydrogenase / fumarate reductase cytochrome b subunit